MFCYERERNEGFRTVKDRVNAYRAQRARRGPSVGLALGAGAARGLAHIGVLEVLEEAGVQVDLIAGCSIGAVIGGLVASGTACEEIAKMASGINRLRVLAYTDLTFPAKGFLSGHRIEGFLKGCFGEKVIEETSIPFVAAATDILTGDEIVIDTGLLTDGVRASISIPALFVPHRIGKRLLVDGGLVNPVPVDYLRLSGIDVCISVNVMPRVDRRYIEKPSTIDILLNAFDISERRIALSRNQPADVEIYPEVDQVSGIEFWRACELMELGEMAARQQIDRILELVG